MLQIGVGFEQSPLAQQLPATQDPLQHFFPVPQSASYVQVVQRCVDVLQVGLGFEQSVLLSQQRQSP